MLAQKRSARVRNVPRVKSQENRSWSTGPHSLGDSETTETPHLSGLSTRGSNSGLRNVQRKNAVQFLNLPHVTMYCTRVFRERLQETTDAPTTKSHRSQTNKKLKYITKTTEGKSPADKGNPMNPRPAHTMMCPYVSKPFYSFSLCLGTLIILKSEMGEVTNNLPFDSAYIISPNIRSPKGKESPRLAASYIRFKVHLHLIRFEECNLSTAQICFSTVESSEGLSQSKFSALLV